MTLLQRLTVPNHRGSAIPAVLGFVLVAGGALGVIGVALNGITPAGAVASGAALLVAAAGVVDDLAPLGPRGLRGHLAALAHGRVTTGVVKLVVITGASLVTVAVSGRSGGSVRLSGVLLIAASTNLWNGLDVRPGRALKWFLLICATGVVWMPQEAPFATGVGVAALMVLILDLHERAMLGDAGANLLGFTAGVSLYLRSPQPWVLYEAAAMVALNILADTISLTRVIDAVPPLRWFDRIGTLPADLVEEIGP